MKLELSTLEMQIVRFLGEHYPVTVDDIRKEISARPDSITRAIKSLVAKGVIELEPLPDKTYVRLLITGLVGESRPSGTRAVEGEESADDDSFMYM